MKRPIEELIIDYFKIINPNHSDEVSLRFNQNRSICFITVSCDTYNVWCSYIKVRQGNKLTEQLRHRMEDMFPIYGFYLSLSLKFDFDKVS
jgi:hypothetical protein